MLTGSQIRQRFLDYFAQRGHRIVHSSPTVPANDPTLLFTNAGMNQFKDVFLGLEKRDYTRATTSQKCVRAGGKHNDLENVGFTKRHHTFFEMLGNFSFGDYFKKDAVAYAWELVTSPEWFGIAKEKLYVTIFEGDKNVPRDKEAEQFWLAQQVAPERIFAMGAKDNFWAMGDTGPCGPCSEIHYDMGAAASDLGHTDCKFPCDCGRYVEIWNLVFMQFDRDASGKLNPLPKPSIDTGAGLERMTAVLQGKLSNFETDLFMPLIRRGEKLTGVKYGANDKSDASLRIIADHARASTFLIADGVLPANEGRGYVLRKILRRGIRHGRLLGMEKPFMFDMVHAVVAEMKDAYPELLDSAERVAKVVLTEEERFAHTLSIGLSKLEELIAASADTKKTSGAEAFKLYDTFGLPLDFMTDAARDAGLEFDHAGFEAAMKEQRERARASWKGGAKSTAAPVFREMEKTVFEGYTRSSSEDCKIIALVTNGAGVNELKAGEHGEVVLDHTPFYADSGGQVGDTGWFYSADGNTIVAEVKGCTMPVQGVRAHKVIARQPLALGDRVRAVVDVTVRQATVRNHTATHLLHTALRETLGTHVKQAGSLVAPERLRFDFSHFTGVADEELQDIEDMVNQQVLRNTRVEVIPDVPIDTAVNEFKAMALFGEKYGDKVRVVRIGDFSTELCGGIHTGATGEIGLIKLMNEASVSSGVRRVEAITGESSLKHFRRDHRIVDVAGKVLGASTHESEGGDGAENFRRALLGKEDEIKKLRKELEQMRMKSASAAVSSASGEAFESAGIKFIARRVDGVDRGQLRTLVDNLRNKLGSGVVVLGSATEDGKVALIVGVTKDLVGKVQAGKIVGEVAKKVGGSGGGRPDMAEAGGKDPAQLDAALSSVGDVLKSLAG